MKIHDELLQLRQKEKRITSEILEKLQLMEDRRGYLKLGYSSLFDYLVRGLNYSEATAYQRQALIRLSRELPDIKTKIEQGSLSLSAVTAAYKYIRKQPLEEKRQSLRRIEHRSAREVRQLFSEAIPPIKIKKTEYRDKVFLRLELTHEQNQKLEKLKALKSHKHNVESLIVQLIDQELQKFANTQFRTTTSKNPRQISQRLRNAVLKKARYACEFPGCGSNHLLQVDHIVPVRAGGDQRLSNLQILCAGHNSMKGYLTVLESLIAPELFETMF